MTKCPAGHETQATDYCDTCGLAIDASAVDADVADGADGADADPATGATSSETSCPNCQASNPANALFCEACGYDFTTGAMPRTAEPAEIEEVAQQPSGDRSPSDDNPSPPVAEGWVAEIWIDPDWYADQDSSDPLPSAGVPVVVRLKTMSVLVGRTSRSRNIHPDIDLTSDNGISRRHCQLTTDGKRWWVEDLGSSNGTYVGGPIGPLPADPLDPGEKREIAPEERIYLGAWSRIVIRKAAPGELS